MTPEQDRRSHILFPYLTEQMDTVRKGNRRFVHYTNAEVACSIIEKSCIWMRNSVTMNDYSEVSYGTRCLDFAWNNAAGNSFRSALSKLGPNIVPALQAAFFDEDQRRAIRSDTYLTSFSEHDEGFEDKYGRLSMWRAYGGQNGVALVVKNAPFMSELDALGAYSSPVAYLTEGGFADHMQKIADGIEDNLDAFDGLPELEIVGQIYMMLLFATLCTKHPGFAEEREWRAIYSARWPLKALKMEVQCVRGVPQVIYKIPLRDVPEYGLTGTAIKDVIDRVIIGPTLYPYPAYLGLTELLRRAGVEDPEERVHVSTLPLRAP